MKVYVRVQTDEQLRVVRDVADAVIYNGDTSGFGGDVYTELPDVLRLSSDAPRFPSDAPCGGEPLSHNGTPAFTGNVLIKNIDELGLVKGFKGKVLADSFLYAYNQKARDFILDVCPQIEFIAPDELSDDELFGDVIYKVYGRQRVMFTAQNIPGNYGTASSQQAASGQTAGADECTLESAHGDRLLCRWNGEYTTIINDEPVSVTDRPARFSKVLLDFTVESGEETAAVIKAFREGLKVPGSTYGYHFKGVE